MSSDQNAKKKLTNKEKKKHVIFLGINFKASLLVILCVSLCFGVGLLIAILGHTYIAVAMNVVGDRMLGRTIAISVDQPTAVRLFEETERIYYELPEDQRSDPHSSDYLSRFSDLKDDDYTELRNQLIKFQKTNDLKWIDLRFIDRENDRYIYVVDSEERQDDAYSTGYWSYVGDATTTFMDSDDTDGFKSLEMDTGLISTITTRGTISGSEQFCVLAPFYHPETGEQIGFVGIGEEVSLITDDLYFFSAFYLGVALVFVIIIVIIFRIFFKVAIIKPVSQLTKAARKYVQTDDKLHSDPVFADVRINTHDEIHVLAESMQEMELDLGSYMENLTELAAKQERMDAELNVAESIQTSMLPEELIGYAGPREFRISADMKPAREVGGDFYDYFVIDDDHIGLSIADVSGKGVPAALFMAICKTLLQSASKDDDSPADIVQKVNTRLCENNHEMMFVTVWLGIYTVSTRELTYVNAGHEYPAIYRAATDRYEILIEDHDMVLGYDTDIVFKEHSITLEPGDKIFVYTDGVPEATSSTDELYGTDRMLNVLNSDTSHTGSEIFDSLRDDIERFIDGAEQFDDMTMLLIEITDRDPDDEGRQ